MTTNRPSHWNLPTLSSSSPVALVTGGARPGRVGAAIVARLQRAGLQVITTSRTSLKTEIAPTSSGTEPIGPNSARESATAVLRCDLSDLESVTALGTHLTGALPRLDVLVHNASTYAAGSDSRLSPQSLITTYAVNAAAPTLLSQILAPLLARSALPGGGVIVCLGDVHAMGLAGRPRRTDLAYSMSKAALLESVLVLARTLAPNVRVNAVAPGVVAFPEDGPESRPEFQERYLRRVPLGRAGTPEDAADAVEFLALHARYITGTVLRVDGGRWLT
jgi:pteridine reductase